MGLADGSIDILVGTHAIFQQAVAYKRPRPRRGRRAASLRRRPADDARAEGRAAAASAGDDRDADPAHADAHPLWRDGRQPPRRDAAGPPAGRDAGDQRGTAAPKSSTRSAAISARAGRPIGSARWSRRARPVDLAAAEARAADAALALRRQGRPRPRPDEGAREGCGDGAFAARTRSACWSRRR